MFKGVVHFFFVTFADIFTHPHVIQDIHVILSSVEN